MISLLSCNFAACQLPSSPSSPYSISVIAFCCFVVGMVIAALRFLLIAFFIVIIIVILKENVTSVKLINLKKGLYTESM